MKDMYMIYDFASHELVAKDCDKRKAEVLMRMYMYQHKGCELIEYRVCGNNKRFFVNSFTN